MRKHLAFPLLACLPLASHALLDDWLPDPDAFVGHDSVTAVIVYNKDTSFQKYSVEERDSKGRPLFSRLEFVPRSGDTTVSTYEFVWDFDLGWSPVVGAAGCPARMFETIVYGPTCTKGYTRDYTRSADLRSIKATSTGQSRLCRWTDSLSYDALGRMVEHRTCEQAYRSTSASEKVDTVGRVQIRRMGYEKDVDRHPRWIVLEDEDTAFYTWDSVHVIGPVDRPEGADLFDGGRGYTYMIGRDSVVRDGQGQVLSRKRSYHTASDPTEHPLDLWEYDWKDGDLVRKRRFGWCRGDTVCSRSLADYSYGSLATSGIRKPAIAGAAVRRSGDGRLAMTFSDTRSAARIEWISFDGGRVVLHDGPVSDALRLAAPCGPALLRIRQGGRISTLGLPPF